MQNAVVMSTVADNTAALLSIRNAADAVNETKQKKNVLTTEESIQREIERASQRTSERKP